MKPTKLQETKSTIRFNAKFFRPKAKERTGSWTLPLPKNASAKLPSRGRTMVEGTINSFPFRAALEPNGKGSHWLRVNKTMRAGAGRVGGHHATGAGRLDFLDKLSQGTGNAQTADRESVRHACVWKATAVLFPRYQVDYERKREIMR